MNRTSVKDISFSAWRYHFVLGVMLLLIAGLMLRMIYLAVIEKPFLLSQGDARSKRVLTVPAFRGIITDRQGYPLAISATVFSVWMNPKEIVHDATNMLELAKILKIKPKVLAATLKRYEGTEREFVYLKRDITPAIAKKIKSLHLPGIYLDEDYKRFYPEGEVTAHVIGFTNIDDKGQEGIELAYNDWLIGTPGKEVVIKDRLGRVISNVQNLAEKKPGHDLALSLHRRMQYIAYRELLAGIQENKAESGSIVVLDVETGEVLAMVNYPSFNPNHRSGQSSAAFRNRAVTDIFEPGSTIKAFSVASSLESGLFTPKTLIQTYPGWMRVGHNLVRDEHNTKDLTVAEVLQVSSNVGITKMILALPPNQLWSLLHRVGFGEETEIRFPGERSGQLVKRERWQPFALATLAFGYGMSATTLQLAHAYAVFANHGIKVPLSILRVDKAPVGEQVIEPKIANQMMGLLESVVESKEGTGTAARIPGYRVAGKTGTARIAGPGGYEKDHHISSFVGIAPVSHPKYVVAVVIRDPQGKHFLAGFVAAPIFKRIMEGVLRISNTPTDEETRVV